MICAGPIRLRKALIGKAAAQTNDEPWPVVGHLCNLFGEEECYSLFKTAGYMKETERAEAALRPRAVGGRSGL